MEARWEERLLLKLDKNDVHVDKAEWKITKNIVHHDMEHVPCFSETKRHAKKLNHAKRITIWVFWMS